jgi:hypothetical protein
VITNEELVAARAAILDRAVSFFAVLDTGNVPASPWFKLPATIFLDRDGLVQSTLATSQRLTMSPPPNTEVSRVLSKALAGAHEVVRRARRGELFFAHSLLDELRSNMTRLDAWLIGFRASGPHRTSSSAAASARKSRLRSARRTSD